MFMCENDVVFLSHRRIFQNDEPRYFLGRVTACDGSLLKVAGYTFVRDLASGRILRKDELRTKVLSLVSPGYIVYQLPSDVDIATTCVRSADGDAILADGDRDLMNLSEHAHCGHF